MQAEGKICADCNDLKVVTAAHRIMPSGRPVCDEHYRQRMRAPVAPPRTHVRVDPMNLLPELGVGVHVAAPSPAQQIAEERKPVAEKKSIDWNAVQRDRDAGATTIALGEKYGCSNATICTHTHPAKDKVKQTPRIDLSIKRRAPEARNNGGDPVAAAIAHLREKRDALTALIDQLEKSRTLLS